MSAGTYAAFDNKTRMKKIALNTFIYLMKITKYI